MTVLEVDGTGKSGPNRVATADLAKANDKVKIVILMQDSGKVVDDNTTKMVPTCVQPLTVTTNVDVLGSKAVI